MKQSQSPHRVSQTSTAETPTGSPHEATMKHPSPFLFLQLLASTKFFSLGGGMLASAAETTTTTCQTSSPTLPAATSTLDLAGLAASNDSHRPIVYTIAGSDSGGGAGIQADLHAIHALGGHGCSAITCLTAQNSVGVTGVFTATDFLQAQLTALLADLPPAAVKIGMLGTRDLVEQVGAFCRQLQEDARSSGRPPVWIVVSPSKRQTPPCSSMTSHHRRFPDLFHSSIPS